jgi:hypothetical protein
MVVRLLNNIIPFVTSYNPRDYNIFHFMKQIEYNLNSSERMKNVLQKRKIITSKRQPKNLKRFLSSSKFDFYESSPSVKKCTNKKEPRLHLRMDGLLQLCKIYHAKLRILHTQLFALIVENSM